MIDVVRDGAGQPGHCCVCGRRWHRDCLCLPCRREFTQPDGQLVPWVAQLRRDARALAERARLRRPHRSKRGHPVPGVVLLSLDQLLGELEAGVVASRAALLAEAALASPDEGLAAPASEAGPGAGRAPSLGRWLAEQAFDAVGAMRVYTASGVPLDMLDFLGRLATLGWPPPGTAVDRRHREDVVDFYERVYPA